MSEALAAPSAAARARNAPWIQSPAWDLFWMFSALWGGALLLLASALAPVAWIAVVLFGISRVPAVLHAWSTTWMVLGSPLLAEERRARPGAFRLAPALIVAGSLALGFGVVAAPVFPPDGRLTLAAWPFALYIGLYWVGHFWHFGNQDFGVLTLYRVRAGRTHPTDRRLDKLYTAALMYGIQPLVYLAVVQTTAFAELGHALLPGFAPLAAPAATLAVGAALLATAGMVARELSRSDRSAPRLLYFAVLLLHPLVPWLGAHLGHPELGLLHLVAYLWSHWLIAIGLVARLNTGLHRARGDPPGVAAARHWALLGAIGGVVLIVTGPGLAYLLFDTDGYRYKELLASIEPVARPWIGLLLGFFLGEQLLHYYCDRRLFRLREPGIRRRVAPLLLAERPSAG